MLNFNPSTSHNSSYYISIFIYYISQTDLQNQPSQCPCMMVGYTPYEVGAHYETDDCQECVCVLGGVPKCKDKECPKCEPGLRANKKKGCQCVCEECPPGEVMCKTSSVCIPTEAWCNGIEDCPDDEVDCKPLKPTIETIYSELIDRLIQK